MMTPVPTVSLLVPGLVTLRATTPSRTLRTARTVGVSRDERREDGALFSVAAPPASAGPAHRHRATQAPRRRMVIHPFGNQAPSRAVGRSSGRGATAWRSYGFPSPPRDGFGFVVSMNRVGPLSPTIEHGEERWGRNRW